MFKTYLDSHLPQRLFSALFMALFAILVPRMLLDVYFRFLDKTEYITITQPVSIDKKQYMPCETVILTTQVKSSIDTNVHSLTQLILIREDDSHFIASGSADARDIPIRSSGPKVISGSITLPCNLGDGRYFWQGNASYTVRGYQKNTSFISDTFNVSKNGLSPSGQTLQDQIDDLK